VDDKSNIASYKLGEQFFSCPVALATSAINGKWKLQILHRLTDAACLRFSELKKAVEGVSEKMLIQHLKELEKDGLIERKVYSAVPPKVEYGLTSSGRSFIPVLDALRLWGSKFEVQK
jgi:DNA-binding HxlR family transcriptional regulator